MSAEHPTKEQDAAPIKLLDGELSDLIRRSTRDNFLSITRTTHGAFLDVCASNEWALKRIAELRGISS